MARSIESLPADMLTIKRIRRSKQLDKELLPGILNDVTLDLICPKLPWREFHTLSTVSHAWRDAIRSRLVYDARVRCSSTETLVVILSQRPGFDPSHTLSLYSTKDKTLNDLPPIPFVRTGIPKDCQCVTLEGKIYILGGLKNIRKISSCSDVYVLDLVGQRKWKQCASMGQPRMRFGCCAKDGKIYVFGGHNRYSPVRGSEMYDPKVNCWSPIKRMISLRMDHQVSAVGEQLVAHGGSFLTPPGVIWNNDHPFVEATESDNDEAKGPHIDEVKNLCSVPVESSEVETEDLLIDPIGSSDNEVENRLVVREASGYVQGLTGDSSDDDEEMWELEEAKFFEIYNPVKKEWELLQPSEDNCLGTIFEAQGKLHQITNNKIYVLDIDTDSWEISQSFSSLTGGPMLDLAFATLAVDRELVTTVICSFYNDNKTHENGVCLLQSTGFGNESEELAWQITKLLPRFIALMCLIQL